MSLSVYGAGKLQDFKSVLNQFKVDGVTDSNVILAAIEAHLNNEFEEEKIASRLATPKGVRITKQKTPIYVENSCPECGSKNWRPNEDEFGTTYVLCRDCQYSELIGEN